jgi:Flp pilus assembly protein TadG
MRRAFHSSSKTQRGHSVVEMALLAPWIFFLFMAVVDVGFYCYAAINTENAARAAALYGATNPAVTGTGTFCNIVTSDMWMLRTVAASPFVAGCGSGSLVVTSPATPPASIDGVAGQTDSIVTVTFQMIPMIPVPGLTGNFTIARTATVRRNLP